MKTTQQNDPIAEAMASNPSAIVKLFKLQAIYRQRKEDEGKPRATASIPRLTREQAQRIADELCQYIQWGEETITPAINA
jgi:hypothetical protein